MNFRMVCMICIAGAMASLMSSCKKNNEDSASLMVSLPEMIVEDGQEERAYIDFTNGGVFKWNANDAIMVYNLDFEDGTQSVKQVYTTDASAEGQTLTRFRGTPVGDKKDGFFYFYPADRAIGGALDVDNRETFSISNTQTYTLDGNGNPTVDPNSLSLACAVNEISDNFTMQHIFGVLRLKLKGTKTVDHIVIRDNKITLSGTASLKLHKVDTDKLNQIMDAYSQGDENIPLMTEYLQQLGWETNGTGKQLTLDCSNVQGVQLSSNTQTVFYISVRPGALIKGFYIDVHFTDGSMVTIENYKNPKSSYCIKPGVIKGFAPAQVL